MKSFLFAVLLSVALIACKESQETKRQKAIDEIEKTRAIIDTDFENDTFIVDHVIDAAESYKKYIRKFADDSVNVPLYFFQSIQLYAIAGQYDTSLAMTERFEKQFPTHPIAADVLHHKAFAILDEGLQDFARAEEAYLLFLEKYPDEKELVKTTLFLLDHLGQDDAAILNQILNDSI